MRDLPDPGDPYADFPAEGEKPGKPPPWQSELGFYTVPACWALWAGLILSDLAGHGPPAILIHGIPLALAVGIPFLAYYGFRWKGFLLGYLIGLGLSALAFGWCVSQFR